MCANTPEHVSHATSPTLNLNLFITQKNQRTHEHQNKVLLKNDDEVLPASPWLQWRNSVLGQCRTIPIGAVGCWVKNDRKQESGGVCLHCTLPPSGCGHAYLADIRCQSSAAQVYTGAWETPGERWVNPFVGGQRNK